MIKPPSQCVIGMGVFDQLFLFASPVADRFSHQTPSIPRARWHGDVLALLAQPNGKLTPAAVVPKEIRHGRRRFGHGLRCLGAVGKTDGRPLFSENIELNDRHRQGEPLIIRLHGTRYTSGNHQSIEIGTVVYFFQAVHNGTSLQSHSSTGSTNLRISEKPVGFHVQSAIAGEKRAAVWYQRTVES